MGFKDFFHENLWGDIPVNGKKPSDGVSGGKNLSLSSNTSDGGSSPQPISPTAKMMKKKMKKK